MTDRRCRADLRQVLGHLSDASRLAAWARDITVRRELRSELVEVVAEIDAAWRRVARLYEAACEDYGMGET